MALREIAGRKKYIKAKDLQEGETAIAGWLVRISLGRYGEVYEFETATGEILAINRTGHLKHLMDQADLPVGTYVEIVYVGMEKLESGNMKGRDAHQFKLYTDDDLSRVSQPHPPSKKVIKPDELKEVDDILNDLDDLEGL